MWVEVSEIRCGFYVFVVVLVGFGFGVLVYVVMCGGFDFVLILEYMLVNSYKLGGGDNVVNVILVDFCGYDIFGEIIVLGIVVLIIFVLIEMLMIGVSV